jgi:hypothetical protein
VLALAAPVAVVLTLASTGATAVAAPQLAPRPLPSAPPGALMLEQAGVLVAQFQSCSLGSSVDPTNDVRSGPGGSVPRQVGTVQPAVITCVREMDQTTALDTWYQQAREKGVSAARRETTLMAADNQGRIQFTFLLHECWVSKIDYAMAGGAPALENVTLSASQIDRVVPSS